MTARRQPTQLVPKTGKSRLLVGSQLGLGIQAWKFKIARRQPAQPMLTLVGRIGRRQPIQPR